MAEQIKQCPFCGGKAKVQKSRFDRSAEGYSQQEVICTQCGVHVLGEAFNFYAVKYNKDEPQDVKSAIEKWNRRV